MTTPIRTARAGLNLSTLFEQGKTVLYFHAADLVREHFAREGE